MDTTQVMIAGFGGFVSVLFGIIGYFIKRIFKQLDGMQTVSACAQLVRSCGEIRHANKETAELERRTLANELNNLIEGFDELCKCLARFTEGKCP
jgi:hypothetical protein